MLEKRKLADLSLEELCSKIDELKSKNAQLEEECSSICDPKSTRLANIESDININMNIIAKCMTLLETKSLQANQSER